jgi:hypothetical protein
MIRTDKALTHFSQFDFIDREGLEAPATGQNKDGVHQCKKHGSPSTSFTLTSCPLETTKMIYSCFVSSRMYPMLWLEETNHACARRS